MTSHCEAAPSSDLIAAAGSTPSGRLEKSEWIWLILLIAFAGGLRAYHLNAKSFWYDEFATPEVTLGNGFARYKVPVDVVLTHPPDLFDLKQARPIVSTWFSERESQVPPLYTLLIRLWENVFGHGQPSLRIFSLIASTAAVGMLFLVVRELSGTTPAIWAAVIMALAGAQIEYAQEARTYSLLLLEALVAAFALALMQRRGSSRGREILLTVSVLALALTHYFAFGTLVTLAIYACVALPTAVRRRAIYCFLAAFIGWLALGAPVAWEQLHHLNVAHGFDYVRDAGPGHVGRTLLRLVRLPTQYFVEIPINPGATIASAFIFPMAILLAWRRRDLLIWCLWLWLTLLPIVILDLARETRHLDYIRYTLLASPAVYALAACCLSDKRGWLRHIAPLLIALACLLTLPDAYTAWWKADWRALGTALQRNTRPGDVTLYWTGPRMSTYPGYAYLHTSFYRTKPQGPILLITHRPDEKTLAQLHAATGLLFVSPGLLDFSHVLPGMKIKLLDFEPAAGALYRLEWRDH